MMVAIANLWTGVGQKLFRNLRCKTIFQFFDRPNIIYSQFIVPSTSVNFSVKASKFCASNMTEEKGSQLQLPSKNSLYKNLPKIMKAVGFYKHLPITEFESLVDLELDLPYLDKCDVLVQVKATAVNPIDAKLRAPKPGIETLTPPRILGFDGAGIVVAKGDFVEGFELGDEVVFTGDLRRNGSNAQYVAVHEVQITQKPKNLSFEEAAAMPLTSVTAYESLYDRLELSKKDFDKTILIINSAGGVGAIATQLAKHLGLKVIGTASRPETEEFSRKFGANIVLNHKQDLSDQLDAAGYQKGVDYILVNYDPFPYWDVLMKIIKPQGKICLIVDCSQPVDIRPLKDKSITLVSEMMNTRIKYNTEDKYRHKDILKEIVRMLEEGILKTTLTRVMSPINAKNLKEAHKIMENSHMVGKLVLSGF